jgi:hypothetical protein
MGVPEDVKRMADEVASGLIESMRPEIIALVTMELISRVPEVAMPTLDVIPADEDDDDSYELFECPHCLKELDYDDIEMVDIDVRSVASDEADENRLLFDTDATMNHEDFHLKCGKCGLFVGKPNGWSIDWR